MILLISFTLLIQIQVVHINHMLKGNSALMFGCLLILVLIPWMILNIIRILILFANIFLVYLMLILKSI